MKLSDYKRKLDAWAAVLPNGLFEDRGFAEQYKTVRDWLETLDLPEEATPDEYCKSIGTAAAQNRDKAFEDAWWFVHLCIVKSHCLDRLLYMGEELRTIPCTVHQGSWSFSFDPACACATGPNVSGWMPNEPKC